jgi:type II secretory pathway predicted ATPase ExeA
MIRKIPEDIMLARINNTKVSSEQLIAMINEEFGIDTKGDDKTRMLSKLSDFLINQYARGGRSMIIIDEAQNLSPDLLEEIRLLSNLETDKAKLLQIILIGQPELNVTLAKPELEQLRQRIAINTHINPLSREETDAYIRHRLRIAGGGEGVFFQPEAIEAIYGYSKGVPRLINVMCDFTLLAAFVDNRKTVDSELAKEIMAELANGRPEIRPPVPAEESSQNCIEGMEREIGSIKFRVQNLERVVQGAHENDKDMLETWKLLTLKESEIIKREGELFKREGELFEKEDELKRREERIKLTFEESVKELSPHREPE